MKYNGNNLKEVLEAHKRWLYKFKGWSEEDRANLSKADLSYANLRGINLSRACLVEANLRETYLSGANLSEADLRGADLNKACLYKARLYKSNLCKTNLYKSNLIEANMNGTNLTEANLCKANLYKADLGGADLTDADLIEANMNGVDLSEAKNVPFIPLACPDTGAFVAWKKCESESKTVIVKLLIPEDAKRSGGAGRKCRADRAIVLDIQTIDGDTLEGAIAWSIYHSYFTYKVGEIVMPNEPFCENRFDECSSGIHFFINRQEAVEY